jgi:hypothetical protein
MTALAHRLELFDGAHVGDAEHQRPEEDLRHVGIRRAGRAPHNFIFPGPFSMAFFCTCVCKSE